MIAQRRGDAEDTENILEFRIEKGKTMKSVWVFMPMIIPIFLTGLIVNKEKKGEFSDLLGQIIIIWLLFFLGFISGIYY